MLKMICKTLVQLLFVAWTLVFILFCVGCDGARKWDYELISVDTKTSDSNKLDMNMRLKRTKKGDIAYDGYFNFAYDIDETTMVEAVAFRSQTGRAEDYQPMPWSIKKQTYPEYIEGFYEDMVYANLGHCTNLPEPANASPWKRANLTFTECIVEGKGMPEMAPQGYYKVIFTATGEVDWVFETVVKIFDKTPY